MRKILFLTMMLFSVVTFAGQKRTWLMNHSPYDYDVNYQTICPNRLSFYHERLYHGSGVVRGFIDDKCNNKMVSIFSYNTNKFITCAGLPEKFWKLEFTYNPDTCSLS